MIRIRGGASEPIVGAHAQDVRGNTGAPAEMVRRCRGAEGCIFRRMRICYLSRSEGQQPHCEFHAEPVPWNA